MWSAETHTFKRKGKKHWKLWAAITVCFFNTCAVFTDAVYLISRMTAHQDESGEALPTSRQRGHGGFHSKQFKIRSNNAKLYLPNFLTYQKWHRILVLFNPRIYFVMHAVTFYSWSTLSVATAFFFCMLLACNFKWALWGLLYRGTLINSRWSLNSFFPASPKTNETWIYH